MIEELEEYVEAIVALRNGCFELFDALLKLTDAVDRVERWCPDAV